jgi:hypothetical protein
MKDDSLLHFGVNLLPVVLTVLAGAVALATVHSLVKAVFAVRSKAKVRDLLQANLRTDKEFRAFQQSLLAHDRIKSEELAAAFEIIDEKIAKLPAQDRKVIAKGLLQHNRAGAERFLKEVLGISMSRREAHSARKSG